MRRKRTINIKGYQNNNKGYHFDSDSPNWICLATSKLCLTNETRGTLRK